MKLARKTRHDGTVLAWHALRSYTMFGETFYDRHDRYACKRFMRKRNGTMEFGDLRNLKKGDRVCRDCAEKFTQLGQRVDLKPVKKIGLVR